ncbi:MAG: DoxX family protein [Flavobacteriales bacterium]|nr:DoxX family protein [Flavobacteriales bacterium]
MKLHSKPYSVLFEFTYVLLRIGLGLGMLTHGYPKLMKLLEGGEIKFADPIGIGATASLALAVFAEALCSALIALGLLTRAATVPLIITMAVAAFVVHGSDPFGKKEMALLYLLGYLVIFAKGSGKLSLDRLIGRG